MPQLFCEFLCNNERTEQHMYIKLNNFQKPSNLIINKDVFHNHNPNSTRTQMKKKKLLSRE